MKKSLIIFSFLLVVFIAPSVFAQEEGNQLWYTIKQTVKPDKIDSYKELSKIFVSAFKEHNFSNAYYVWQSNIYDFYWFYPVDDYNHIEQVSSEAWKIIPEMEKGIMKKFYENVEYTETFFIKSIDSLSYDPETNVEGLVYGEWWIHYTVPWTGMKYRKAFKQAVEMLKKANYEYPTATFRSDIGMNGGNSYISLFWGKDVVDLNKQQAKAWENIGAEAQQMIRELDPVRRKFEKIPFWYQKELSYTPE